jgi:thienamycin biosynthesis protein ThnN
MMQEVLDPWLEKILKIHFDPEWGSVYWLEKADQLGFTPLREIHTLKDLILLGPMDEDPLRKRPIEDFVPRRYWADKSKWVVGETGGMTGLPKRTVYLEEEFHQAFIHPFEVVAGYRNFPRGQNWLWVGPSGPHIVGKAATACAKALGSPDPFTVDFDPRWVRRFPPDSIGFKRYLDHIIEQTLRIITTQDVKVLFITPKVLARLKEEMTRKHREALLGIHFAGMELDKDLFQAIKESFPNAVFISGYGNTLFGMCPEFTGDPGHSLDYYPIGPRLIFQTVPLGAEMSPEEKLRRPCSEGEDGQIVFSRLDQTFMIINQFERDQGELIKPPETLGQLNCMGSGIRNPQPLKTGGGTAHAATGLY